jgi:protein SCO1/2
VIAQPDARTVTLAHNAIKDFMPAMAMDIQSDDLPSLKAGDRIRATLVVTAETTRLTDVVVTGRFGGGAAPPLVGVDAGFLVPDVPLRNQFDRTVRMSEFRGRVLVVTFIYTRCPLPDFCPRLMRNFQDLRRTLGTRPELLAKVHLLGVTIDPEFDTPDVLRAYGEARLGGKHAFERLDLATGGAADVAKLATFFGLRYEPAAGQISHTLVTGIVGTDGRIVKRFPEMMGNLEDAVAIVEREAARASPF